MNKKANGKKKWLKIAEPLHWRLKELAANQKMLLNDFAEQELWKIAKRKSESPTE